MLVKNWPILRTVREAPRMWFIAGRAWPSSWPNLWFYLLKMQLFTQPAQNLGGAAGSSCVLLPLL